MALFDKLFGTRTPKNAANASHTPLREATMRGSPRAQEAASLLRAPTAYMQLSEAEALAIVGFMTPRRYPSGTTIIRQGDADDTGFMVLVLDGEITVENQIGHRPNPVTVNVLGPGSLVGEMALVDGAARSATCTASTDVHSAVLTREALQALIAERPATGAKLMTALAQRLAERLREAIHKQQIYSKLLQSMQEELDAPLRMRTPGPQSPVS